MAVVSTTVRLPEELWHAVSLSTPVADLRLSARAAACLHLLNIRSRPTRSPERRGHHDTQDSFQGHLGTGPP